MDTELFMECEEEELEPWQQVDDSVEEDDMDFTDNCGPGERVFTHLQAHTQTHTCLITPVCFPPVEDSLSPLPASETPPSSSTPATTGM